MKQAHTLPVPSIAPSPTPSEGPAQPTTSYAPPFVWEVCLLKEPWDQTIQVKELQFHQLQHLKLHLLWALRLWTIMSLTTLLPKVSSSTRAKSPSFLWILLLLRRTLSSLFKRSALKSSWPTGWQSWWPSLLAPNVTAGTRNLIMEHDMIAMEQV